MSSSKNKLILRREYFVFKNKRIKYSNLVRQYIYMVIFVKNKKKTIYRNTYPVILFLILLFSRISRYDSR